MNLEAIINPAHPMYCKAIELYQASFPFHEQREPPSQIKILNDDEYHFSLIYDEATFIGLVLYWETETFIYIEHLCILPELRGKQYGGKTLSLLKEKRKKLILEIDPPVDDISERRRRFYQRQGFIKNPFQHVHPPYHKGNKGHNLTVMAYPNPLSREEYDTFDEYLQNRVMRSALL